jgi:hypothetical protein
MEIQLDYLKQCSSTGGTLIDEDVTNSKIHTKKPVACSRQANYTDRAAAAG